MDTKNPITSKQNILGILMIVIALLNFFGASPLLAEYSQYIMLVSGALIIVLRMLTTTELSWDVKPTLIDLKK